MEFKVLGPLEVCRNGQALAMPGGKPRALLAVLLLHANEPVSAEHLAMALWGEEAPAGAMRTVQVYVSRLRKALGDDGVLASTAAGYRLRVAPGELDAERFEQLLDQGRRALADANADQAAGVLREALELWRGPALADLAFEPFTQAEIARLEEQRLAAVEARVEADLAAGRHAELVPELQRLVAEHPVRESLHGHLIRALYRAGRQADALSAYRHARELLVEQLGIEPRAELRALERAVLAQDPALDLAERETTTGRWAANAEFSGAERVRVPLSPTQTVGRMRAIAALEAAIGTWSGRLVTVVGAGGVGKTRVAIELARAVGPGLRDGAVFVSLAALESPEHVASTIARELDVTPAQKDSVERALARHLARRELLLVLDNFEHLLDAAPLVADLLAKAPALRVLATSREPLRLRAEQLFRLEPLPVTPEHGGREPAPAVALFAGAVRARDPAFTLTEEDLPAIVEVCWRLDDLPLAIELAAGRVGLLSPFELAARLRSGLDALGVAPRDAPIRQRTLTATLEWSYELLSPGEQRLLAGLAVFAGGCSLDAAQAVTRTTLEALESLVDKNLLLAETAHDGHGRLAMLETVRAFARRRLEQDPNAESVARRHCEYYVEVAERTQPELELTSSQALVAELDRELDNLRAAFAWALAHAPVLALKLAAATQRYWFLSSVRSEAEEWLTAALALPAESVPVAVRAAALQHYGFVLAKQGTTEEAERAARESLELWRSLGNLTGCARSSAVLSHVLMWTDRTREAYDCAAEALRLADLAADQQARVWALDHMAMLAPTVSEALSLGEQASAAWRAVGNQRQFAALQTSLVTPHWFTATTRRRCHSAFRRSRAPAPTATHGFSRSPRATPASLRCSTAARTPPGTRSRASCAWAAHTGSTAGMPGCCSKPLAVGGSRGGRRPRSHRRHNQRRRRRRNHRPPRADHRSSPRRTVLRASTRAPGRANVAKRLRRWRNARPRPSDRSRDANPAAARHRLVS
jgi:predicted ATPase/DNA-binding SARP family transcriptional activator